MFEVARESRNRKFESVSFVDEAVAGKRGFSWTVRSGSAALDQCGNLLFPGKIWLRPSASGLLRNQQLTALGAPVCPGGGLVRGTAVNGRIGLVE
jgi:hypothetical protein